MTTSLHVIAGPLRYQHLTRNSPLDIMLVTLLQARAIEVTSLWFSHCISYSHEGKSSH